MPTPPRVLVARNIFPDIVERLRAQFDVDLHADAAPLARDELVRRLQGKAGALITSTERIDA